MCEHCTEEIVFIDPTDMVEILSLDELYHNVHLNRNREEENDLHTVMFKCDDGNNVAYIFQSPIKYVDEKGIVRDINTSIRTNDEKSCIINDSAKGRYSFSSVENEFQIFYSDSIYDDLPTLMISCDQWNVGISPYVDNVPIESGVTLEAEGMEYNVNQLDFKNNNVTEYDCIKYHNAFGDNTLLQYHTTYTGCKEIIQISAKPDENVFRFKLKTNGLIPFVASDNSVRFSDQITNNEIASFSPLYVYDNSEVPLTTINNSYSIEKDMFEENTYILSLIIDEDYLNSESVTYPVIIDPTFILNTSSSIDDAPIYTGYPNLNHGSNYFNCVGYVDSAYGSGSLMVKFPGLKNSSWFNELADSKIASVTYNVFKVGGDTNYTSELRAYNYIGNQWYENTVTYNSANIGSNTGTFVNSVNMTANKKYKFDITSSALAWKNGTKDYDKGLVIKNITNNTNVNYQRTLASVEYGSGIDVSYMPYICVVYNNSGVSPSFDSANLAARDFAKSTYAATEYVRIEHAATIYLKNGKYYYYDVHSGNPHSVNVSTIVPSGATYIGYIHTHPNSESFSDADKNFADNHGGLAYVVTPLHNVKRYNSTTNVEDTVYTNLAIRSLTNDEKESLVSSLSSVWYGHLVSGVCPNGFHCETKTWPNE